MICSLDRWPPCPYRRGDQPPTLASAAGVDDCVQEVVVGAAAADDETDGTWAWAGAVVLVYATGRPGAGTS